MSAHDPVALIRAFDAAWNRHDLEAVMTFFGESAIVRLAPPPPDGGIYSGRDQIRAWAEILLPGFHVESADPCVTGDQITWKFTVSADAFRRLGVDPVTGTADARLLDERIQSFTVTFDSQTASKLQAS